MDVEQLAAIRERAEKATDGEWVAVDDPSDAFPHGNWTVVTESPDSQDITGWGLPATDAEFIAHARTDIPELLDEIDRLRAFLGEARDIATALNRRLEARAALERLTAEFAGEGSP